jgi:DNA-binding transcriptional LysR family regulator
MNLRALEIFIEVAERRSFAQAAKALGLTASGVSNAIARLEQQLGASLIARTTRSVNLTPDGAAFFERCRDALSGLRAAETGVKDARITPSGVLRVDAPVSFGRMKLLPMLGDFQARYPALDLMVSLNDRRIDLIDEGIDVAIRIGHMPDSSLIAQTLRKSRLRVVGSADYLSRRQTPTTFADLAGHNCIRIARADMRAPAPWRFAIDGAVRSVAVQGNLIVNDTGALLEAALAGLGLIQTLDYLTEDAVADGRLRPVLEPHSPGDTPISLVFLPHRQRTPRVRAFIQFMMDRSAQSHPSVGPIDHI